MKGGWDTWPRAGLYEVPQKSYVSKDFGEETPPAGWVARLFSGNSGLEVCVLELILFQEAKVLLVILY